MNAFAVNINDTNFTYEVEQAELPVLLDFWKQECRLCDMLELLLKQLAQRYQGRIKFVKINGLDNKMLTERFHIRDFPTLLLLKRGEPVWRLAGVNNMSRFTAQLDQHAMPAATTMPSMPTKRYCAFHGDVAVRDKYVERVRRRHAARQIFAARFAVCNTKQQRYSIVGATLHGTDMVQYERELGIPAILACWQQAIVSCFLPQPGFEEAQRLEILQSPQARDYPTQWLKCIQPGAVLDAAPARFLRWLLFDLVDPYHAPLAPVDADVAIAARTIASLHQRWINCDAPPAKEWADVRQVAIMATDKTRETTYSNAIGRFVESVAWSVDELNDAGMFATEAFDIFQSFPEAAVRASYTDAQWQVRETTQKASVAEMWKAREVFCQQFPDASEEAWGQLELQVIKAYQNATRAYAHDEETYRNATLVLAERIHAGFLNALVEHL